MFRNIVSEGQLLDTIELHAELIHLMICLEEFNNDYCSNILNGYSENVTFVLYYTKKSIVSILTNKLNKLFEHHGILNIMVAAFLGSTRDLST